MVLSKMLLFLISIAKELVPNLGLLDIVMSEQGLQYQNPMVCGLVTKALGQRSIFC
ncbi:hypothetical protein RHMOL_Rhmol08G0100800 [Rhododendron molle]|uniref:Uncharacterized protein n=1 Tax=Rhododendron molle TaxID=49168 RepID=A0ACC0MLL7_RHOML|nr:hypothetical protein RHMOL_Rhmol08G0100800 [Rhododendron molle]